MTQIYDASCSQNNITIILLNRTLKVNFNIYIDYRIFNNNSNSIEKCQLLMEYYLKLKKLSNTLNYFPN